MAEKQANLGIILSELYEIPTLKGKNTIQFSFATKLLHTIDNNKPIYDQNLAGIIKRWRQGFNKDEKISSCIEIYNYLEKLYLNMLQDTRITGIISKFRLKFKDSKDISDTKILDFIMWSYGDLIKNIEKIKKDES
mgnify:CR=1 FL=1